MPGFIQAADRVKTADDRAGREIGPRQEFHQVTHGCGRIFQQVNGGVDHLSEVVRRNIRRHADADPHAAVDQQIREFRRQDFRLSRVFIERRNHIDGIFINIAQQFFRETLHAALRITVSRGRVAVDASEVALTVDQRHTHGKILRHADQRIVNRGIAVRMIFTDHFADHTRAFHMGT